MRTNLKRILIGVAALAVLAAAAFVFFGGSAHSGSATGEVIASSENGGSCVVTYFPNDGNIEISLLPDDNNEDGSEVIVEGETYVDPDPANWRVRDIYGNIVDAEVVLEGDKLIIKAPEGGYQSGGIYVLDIGPNAVFASDEYGNSRHMVFAVDRGESETVVLNENVYEAESKDVSFDGDNLTVEGRYGENDILIGDFDNDGLNEAIKLVDVSASNNTTKAKYVEPTADEVYEELDVFAVKYVDFSTGRYAEDIAAKESEPSAVVGLLGAITDSVYADDEDAGSDDNIGKKGLNGWKFSHEYGMRDAGIKEDTVKAPYLTVKGEYKQGVADISFSVDTEAPVLVVVDKGVAYLDVEIRNKSIFDANFQKELLIDPEKETTEEVLKKFDENKNSPKQELGGQKDIVSDIEIPIGPTGKLIKEILNVRLDFFAEIGADLRAQIKNNLTSNAALYLRAWYVYKGSDEGEYETGVDYSISAVMTNDLSGKVELFAGVGLRLAAGYPAIVEFKAEGAAGPYADLNGALHMETSFKAPPISKPKFEWRGMFAMEGGLKVKAKINAKHEGLLVDWFDFDDDLLKVEKKVPIVAYSTPKPVLNIGLKDSYIVNEGKLNLGDIDVTYVDMISNEEEEALLKVGSYNVDIDGTPISDLTKLGAKESSLGKHTIKISWTHNGDDYEYDKEVEFVEGAQVVWVVEPTDKYSDIGQLETTRGRWVKGRSDEEFYSCIMNNIGYPQQWFDAVVPESYGGGTFTYSADAVAIKGNGEGASGKWGIVDYDGNVLVEPSISSITQSPYPFRGISRGYSGLGYEQSSDSSSGFDGVAHIFSSDFSKIAFEYGIQTGGGMYSAYYFAHEGKLYRSDNTRSTEVASVPEQLKTALIPGYGNDSAPYGLYVTDYTYITKGGEIITQETYYVKNYVNGYYVGLPEMAENSYDLSSGDLVYGASFAATPLSPNQKFAIIEAASGKPITDYKYYDALYFEEGYCPVCRDGKWGFIDSNGVEVTEMIFDKVSSVYEGKVAVIYEGKFAIINLKDTIAGGVLTGEIWNDAFRSEEANISEELAAGASEKDDITYTILDLKEQTPEDTIDYQLIQFKSKSGAYKNLDKINEGWKGVIQKKLIDYAAEVPNNVFTHTIEGVVIEDKFISISSRQTNFAGIVSGLSFSIDAVFDIVTGERLNVSDFTRLSIDELNKRINENRPEENPVSSGSPLDPFDFNNYEADRLYDFMVDSDGDIWVSNAGFFGSRATVYVKVGNISEFGYEQEENSKPKNIEEGIKKNTEQSIETYLAQFNPGNAMKCELKENTLFYSYTFPEEIPEAHIPVYKEEITTIIKDNLRLYTNTAAILESDSGVEGAVVQINYYTNDGKEMVSIKINKTGLVE